MKKSELEDKFAFQLRAVGVEYEREFKAIPGRRYPWDFRIDNLLIEIQGGTWSRGKSGHTSGAGVRRDCEKLNLATLHGWRVLAFTSDMVHDLTALNTVLQIITQK